MQCPDCGKASVIRAKCREQCCDDRPRAPRAANATNPTAHTTYQSFPSSQNLPPVPSSQFNRPPQASNQSAADPSTFTPPAASLYGEDSNLLAQIGSLVSSLQTKNLSPQLRNLSGLLAQGQQSASAGSVQPVNSSRTLDLSEKLSTMKNARNAFQKGNLLLFTFGVRVQGTALTAQYSREPWHPLSSQSRVGTDNTVGRLLGDVAGAINEK